jgi:branched-chain amino acid transport system ATP-binding protein
MQFGGLRCVSDFSFTVSERELVGLIGPNGAGKTTVFNLITGVYRPTAGHIMHNGQDLTNVRVDKIALARVGRAFQHAELFPHMTVTENLLVGRHLLMPGNSGAFYFGRKAREEMKSARRSVITILRTLSIPRVPAGDLPYGVEDGRAPARSLDPELLLLDGPRPA